MASANKQQKRAARAKTKAKQNRTKRAEAPVELDPNDDRIDFESVDLTELFKKMIDAEKISQQALCTAFLEDPLLELVYDCLLYTSPSPRDGLLSRMPSSA